MSSCNSFNLGKTLGLELVTVQVGEEKRKFVLHKQLICDSVQDFRGAFSAGGFKESVESSIDMPEDEPEVFEHFVHWLYRGTILKATKDEDFERLLDLYIFAEKLCINEFANKTIDAIQDMDLRPNPDITLERVRKMWRNTSTYSPLRTWFIDALVHKAWNDACSSEESIPRVDFYIKTLKEMWEVFKGDCDLCTSFFIAAQDSFSKWQSAYPYPHNPADPFKLQPSCYYHRHAKGEICHLQDYATF
ncbi:hypothetical protein SBOR_9992 [Sclerotinia borealis F-4128]|uniref:BTB domain-containing protein n=1 Tax=Sclerotinia borealis (strain F-4128) TaxID=1432307 RepID=W9C4W7_SCLBF|nr:hypothetical protein SBOR_9992 [Sclerotinia borealis F-4128]